MTHTITKDNVSYELVKEGKDLILQGRLQDIWFVGAVTQLEIEAHREMNGGGRFTQNDVDEYVFQNSPEYVLLNEGEVIIHEL